MRSTLRTIGNSRGVILPAHVIQEAGLGEDIEIIVAGGQVTIVSAEPGKLSMQESFQAQAEADNEDFGWLHAASEQALGD